MENFKKLEWLEEYEEHQLQDYDFVENLINDLKHDRNQEINSKYPIKEIIDGTQAAIDFLLKMHVLEVSEEVSAQLRLF